MAWWLALGAALGAGANYLAGEKGADAVQSAGDKNAALARENRNVLLGMYEPSRALGYGATADLAHLYGYRLPEYQSLDALTGPAGAQAGPGAIRVNKNAAMLPPPGGAPGGTPALPAPAGTPTPVAGNVRVRGRDQTNTIAGIAVNPWSNHQAAYGGEIDPYAGTVDLKNIRKAGKEAKLEDKATRYLRGEKDHLRGSKVRRIRNTIDDMKEAGYSYDPNAVRPTPVTPPPPQPTAGFLLPPGSTAGNHAIPVNGGTSADGTAGNFSRFFTSPDYLFRQSEGDKAVQRSAAAQGGLFSGATMKGMARYNQNLASGEFGNWFERLMRMSGMGGAATNAQAGAATDATSTILAGNNATGLARAGSYGQQSDAFNNLISNLYYGYRRGA